jgi:hypothetical protein
MAENPVEYLRRLGRQFSGGVERAGVLNADFTARVEHGRFRQILRTVVFAGDIFSVIKRGEERKPLMLAFLVHSYFQPFNEFAGIRGAAFICFDKMRARDFHHSARPHVAYQREIEIKIERIECFRQQVEFDESGARPGEGGAVKIEYKNENADDRQISQNYDQICPCAITHLLLLSRFYF